MDPLKIAVSELLFSHAGTTVEITVPLPELDDTEVKVLPGQELDFEGIKIDEGVCFYNLTTNLDVEYYCSRCLEKVSIQMPLRTLEKQYYVKIPEDMEEDLVQLIDKKHFEINLLPLIEETVYLSIPTILSCGEKCKGAPKFKPDNVKPETQNPFKNLKDML